MRITLRDMTRTAVFTAALCAIAPLSITVGPIPLTFATLVIYISAGSLGWKRATVSAALYVLIGAAGLPVFSGFEGGFHKIAGLSGGFIIGYIPCALTAGIVSDSFIKKSAKSAKRGRQSAWSALGALAGTVVLYTCGTAWFIRSTGAALTAALASCVAPFLIGDGLKILLASIIAPRLRTAINVRK